MATMVSAFLVVGAVLASPGDAVPCPNPRAEWAGTLCYALTARSLIADPDGNVVFAGCFGGVVDLDPTDGIDEHTGNGSCDVFVVKVLAHGSYAWGYGVGGPEYDEAYGVAATADGSVLVVGDFSGTVDFDPTDAVDEHAPVGGEWNAFVTKLASDGSYLWTLTIGGASWSTDASAGVEGIALDPGGDILITGLCRGTVDFDPGPGTAIGIYGADVFLTKLSSDGSYLWTRLLKPTGSRPMSPGNVAVDADGNVYVSGMFPGSVDFDPGPGVDQRTAMYPYDDVFISKYRPDGSYVWTATYNAFLKPAMAVDPAGSVLITGYFYGTVDFDPDPIATDWRISVEGKDDDIPDIFVTKLHADGSYAWTYTVGGHSQDVGYGVAVDESGNAYVTGQFYGPVDFDPGPGVDEHYPELEGNIFLTKLYCDGSYAWTRTLGTGSWGTGEHIAVNRLGGVVVAGWYRTVADGADFDPGCEVHNLYLHWVEAPDTFIVQLGCPEITTDLDADGDTDLSDFAGFIYCLTGPASTTCETGCTRLDFDADDDIDLVDFSFLQTAFARRSGSWQTED